jgi:hypothetical protein
MTPSSLRLGYRRAPVVVAVANTMFGSDRTLLRKITIAQHETGHADLRRVAVLLSTKEPGWGGSATIIGSPQGISSKLCLQRCIEVLQECGA